MDWSDWQSGETNWPFGPLSADDVLYEYAGPAIFVSKIGLQNFLFYKSSEYKGGDYFIASDISNEALAALKSGRLSVRGALSQKSCWLFDVDLRLNVRRFDQAQFSALSGLIPERGVALNPQAAPVADTIEQAVSPLSFKFFGDELRDGYIPLDIFKSLVNSVYDVVRRSFVPPALVATKAADLLEFQMRQPRLASLLIAIDAPTVDVERLRRRYSTKNLNPEQLAIQAEAEGARFVEEMERTVDKAIAGKVTKSFARENYLLLDNINTIMPSEGGEVSMLQLSSSLGGHNAMIELDRETGARIRHAYKTVRDTSIDVSGTIVGMIEKSRLLILRKPKGREVTCYLVPSIYDDLLARGDLSIGRKVKVSGTYQRRVDRDLMHVDGRPKLL